MNELKYHRFRHSSILGLDFKQVPVVSPEYQIKRIKEKTNLTILDLSSHLGTVADIPKKPRYSSLHVIKQQPKRIEVPKIRYSATSAIKPPSVPRIILKKLSIKKIQKSPLPISNPIPKENLILKPNLSTPLLKGIYQLTYKIKVLT